MLLYQFIHPNRICVDNHSKSKAAILSKISTLLSFGDSSLASGDLFELYWQRETLGSTAIGEGIAIPHIRHARVKNARICCLKLNYPVNFGADDKKPIDLVIGLLVCEQTPELHLQLLSLVASHFKDPLFCRRCRLAKDDHMLYAEIMKQLHKDTPAPVLCSGF